MKKEKEEEWKRIAKKEELLIKEKEDEWARIKNKENSLELEKQEELLKITKKEEILLKERKEYYDLKRILLKKMNKNALTCVNDDEKEKSDELSKSGGSEC